MSAYYNEIDPYAAEWLRNLIKKGLIEDGEVDTRSIVDVAPDDLNGFVQCHFFAGIGGWSHALRLARWPGNKSIWTGSCPCQPFSAAGKRAGENDSRHLWPHLHRLISSCRPSIVMGEQVAGTAGYRWLDGVRADLATEGYASRGVDIPACAMDAPHLRSRIYWVASNMADTKGIRPEEWERQDRRQEFQSCGEGWLDIARNGSFWSDHIWLNGADGKIRRSKSGLPLLAHGVSGRMGKLRAYGNAIVPQVAAEVIKAFMETHWGEQ
jgi:DNA (cytosine-5)-methyltransferase 1